MLSHGQETEQKGRVYVTAEEFKERHHLDLDSLYAALSRGKYLLPDVADVGGQLRFEDKKGASGHRLSPETPLSQLPDDDDGQAYITVEDFCEINGLNADMLLRLSITGDLPKAYSTDRDLDAIVLDARDVRLWKLARKAKAIRGERNGR